MVAHNGLMRIFWPSDAPNGSISGVLVGFRNAQSDVFVVSILQEVEVGWDGPHPHYAQLTLYSYVRSKMPWK